MIGAGEVQRTARELGGQSLALERRWHFGVLQHDAIRESAISNKRAKPIHSGLEAVGLFIVGDNYLVQVQLHTHLASGGQNSISNSPTARRPRSPAARCGRGGPTLHAR